MISKTINDLLKLTFLLFQFQKIVTHFFSVTSFGENWASKRKTVSTLSTSTDFDGSNSTLLPILTWTLKVVILWPNLDTRHQVTQDCNFKQLPKIYNGNQGWDSPTFKLYYLSLKRAFFQWKTMLVEKTVIVELGESRPRTPRKNECEYLPMLGLNIVYFMFWKYCWNRK